MSKVLLDDGTDFISQYGDNKPVHLQKHYSGFWFHKETPENLRNVLANLYGSQARVKVYYGDIKNNQLWGDIEIGRIGRSSGRIKIPLTINNSRSLGGPALLDNCIVKIELSAKPNTVLYLNKAEE